MPATSKLGEDTLVWNEKNDAWEVLEEQPFNYEEIAYKVIAGDFGKQKKTYEKNLRASYCEEAVGIILGLVEKKLTPVVEEPEIISDSIAIEEVVEEFNPYKLAIDIHKGVYGFYQSVQYPALKKAGFTEPQAKEAISIALTID